MVAVQSSLIPAQYKVPLAVFVGAGLVTGLLVRRQMPRSLADRPRPITTRLRNALAAICPHFSLKQLNAALVLATLFAPKELWHSLHLEAKLDKLLTRFGSQPIKVAGTTLAVVFAARYLAKFVDLVRYGQLRKATFAWAFSKARLLPPVKAKITAEREKVAKQLQETMIEALPLDLPRWNTMPDKGVDRPKFLKMLSEWERIETANWSKGQVSGGIYHGGDELRKLGAQVFEMFSLSNPLHPEIFPYVRKMETETIRMAADLFHGDSDVCGCTTSGGTESILMACLAYREWGRERGIENPTIIASVTVHAAFEKAAHYFGMNLVQVPSHPETFQIDVDAVARAIDHNTVALVGSTPAFPQGVMDPIEDLSALALQHGLNLHVDCCLGSFLVPFAEKLGFPLSSRFGFDVPGVTSVSVDTHKFGFAPKGSSIILYRHAEMRNRQFFCSADWTGGIYASPSIPGSRPGGLIASAWATMLALGQQGYKDAVSEIMHSAKAIQSGIRQIHGIHICGHPELSVVAFTSHDPKVNIFQVHEAMTKRKWNLNSLQNPASIHICVTYAHKGDVAHRFIEDLRDAVTEVRDHPERFNEGSAAIYGMAEALPDKTIIGEMAKTFIDCMLRADTRPQNPQPEKSE